MQKRIYRTVAIVVLAAVVLLTVFNAVLSYQTYKGLAEDALKDTAAVVMTDTDDSEEINKRLNLLSYNVRFTRIASDGTVLFESNTNAEGMENHLSRPEVADAFQNGTGEAERYSSTLGEVTYYYAIERDGNVFRFARRLESIVSVIWGIIPVLIVAAGLIVLMSLILSIKLSENVMKPVNQLVAGLDVLDGRKFTLETDYEELALVASAVEKLSSRLERYIRRLKEEKETITLITENMEEGMILLDGKRDILSVNRSAVRMLNPMFVMSDGRNVLELTRNPQFIAMLDKSDEQENVSGDFSIGERSYEAFISRIEPDGANGTVAIIVDTTEKHLGEQMRRDFSANVSHELKTPLTTIKGFAEMMSTGALTAPEDIKKYTGIIYKESERLLLLINDIIRLSEIEEHEKGGLGEVNLKEAAEEAVKAIRFSAEKKGVSIELSAEDIIIQGNRSYIGELLINLIDNAVKYNNPDGKVSVNIASEGGFAVICVADNGIGIPPEHQDKIFQRFYRVDKSRSKQTGGTGLGLSIVKHITEYHNGEIELESCPGKGTKITIKIPHSKQD